MNLYRNRVSTDELGVIDPKCIIEVGTKNGTNGTKSGTDGTKNGTNLINKFSHATGEFEFNEEELKVLAVLYEKPSATQKQIHEETGISLRTLKRMFPKLQEIGKLQRIGNNRSGKWKVLE